MIPLAEAQARVLALKPPVDTETALIADANGRWAADDVVARRTQPARDLSAMDGYAIRFADLPGPWAVTDESAAGRPATRALGPGEAIRIFTGAAMPDGADTVVMQEDVARDGDLLTLTAEGPNRQGRHVRAAGSDFSDGAVLIKTGAKIGAAEIALAAMGGHDRLPVRRRVRVALLSTGDELVPVGTDPGADRIPASNGVMLAAMLAALPCEVVDLGIVPDDLEATTAALRAAQAADIVVTTGGASVGDHDHVLPALEAAGAKIDFWKIAMRPGKPLMAGTLGDAVVLGLPGNPVSAFVTATLFVKPLIAALSGANAPFQPTLRAQLDEPLPEVAKRTDHLRAVLSGGHVAPVGIDDSAALSGLSRANALIVRPAGAPAARPGDWVEVISLS
jgi:molybdopterin molybdotransferase